MAGLHLLHAIVVRLYVYKTGVVNITSETAVSFSRMLPGLHHLELTTMWTLFTNFGDKC